MACTHGDVNEGKRNLHANFTGTKNREGASDAQQSSVHV